MNRKQLTSLLVLVLIIGGAGIAVYKHNSSSWEGVATSGATSRVLGNFVLNDVARVLIQTGTASLTLAKKNDAWVVRERDDYPADFGRVGDFIQALWQLKPVQDVKVGASQLGRLELLPPAKGAAAAATLVDLQNKDSKRMVALLIGKKFLKKSPRFPDEEGFPAGRYVMPSDAVSPKVSLVSETLDQADPNPASWLDKSFLKIDRIQSVALTSGSIPWKLSRDNDTGTEWKLADLKADEKLDAAKVPSFASILGAPGFTDVLPADARRDGFDSTVVVETFDHFAYTLKFGKPDGDNLPLTAAVTADLPKERTPGKDEKPGDKKRLDDEFAATNKRLSETLAKSKTFEARVYLVSKAAFDPLLKPRAELLAPKPTPTPSPTPTPATTPSGEGKPAPASVATSPSAAPTPQSSPAGKN
jgi:hypothetical protein